MRNRLGKRRVVLREHRQAANRGKFREHGRGQFTGRAIPLYHRDQAVGGQRHLWSRHMRLICRVGDDGNAHAGRGPACVALELHRNLRQTNRFRRRRRYHN